MNATEDRIPPLKRFAAKIAAILPPAWRFPVCGLSASVCGLEAARPFVSTAEKGDLRFFEPLAEFFRQEIFPARSLFAPASPSCRAGSPGAAART